VATHAWPYAVSRDDRSGYRAVVVPEFLADAGQAYVLEYASKGQASKPGTVMVREVRGAVTEPLSLAYRVTEARADRDRPGEDDAPRDRAGWSTRVFEGLVLQVPVEQVASLGLTEADLDTVASITAPAFGKLRSAGAHTKAEPSDAICVGDMAPDAQLLDLQIARPWVMPGSGAVSEGNLGTRPGGPGTVPPVWRPDDRRREPADAHPGRTGLIVVAVAVCTLAALLVWYLTRLLPPSPPSIQTSVQQWCSDLRSGDAVDMYSQSSGGYQQSTSLAVFESRLFGSSHSAICTSTVTQAGRASLSLRSADGRDRTVDLDVQNQGGLWRITAMQVSS
jgi:hypothetical protein